MWGLWYDESAGKVLANRTIRQSGTPVMTFGEDDAGEVYFTSEHEVFTFAPKSGGEGDGVMHSYLFKIGCGVLLFLAICAVAEPATAASTASEQFAELLDDSWQFDLVENPLSATECGDHRYDDKLPKVSLADAERRNEATREFLERLEKIDRSAAHHGRAGELRHFRPAAPAVARSVRVRNSSDADHRPERISHRVSWNCPAICSSTRSRITRTTSHGFEASTTTRPATLS